MCLNITDAQVKDIMDRIDVAESKFGNMFDNMYLSMYTDEDSSADNMDDFIMSIGTSSYEYGMSKVVLFFDEYEDFVVKIPVKGCIVYEYDEDEWIETEKHEYENAPTESKGDWDYCHAEELVYRKAVTRGVEKAFAETRCIGHTRSGYPIYASEKITSYTSNMTKKKQDRFFEFIKSAGIICGMLGKYTVSELLNSYPVMFALDVVEFLRVNDIDGDMHSSNYLYDDDGHIVFVDYSDFRDHV